MQINENRMIWDWKRIVCAYRYTYTQCRYTCTCTMQEYNKILSKNTIQYIARIQYNTQEEYNTIHSKNTMRYLVRIQYDTK